MGVWGSRSRPLIIVALIALVAAGCAAGAGWPGPPSREAAEGPIRLDVIWVPTDLAVVTEMLTLAGITRDDVVYDLGCGDGGSSSPEINLRLQPKLLRELRPGSRVVSHRYGIGDWKPEKMITVTVLERLNWLFLWRIPGPTPAR